MASFTDTSQVGNPSVAPLCRSRAGVSLLRLPKLLEAPCGYFFFSLAFR